MDDKKTPLSLIRVFLFLALLSELLEVSFALPSSIAVFLPPPPPPLLFPPVWGTFGRLVFNLAFLI